MKKATVRLFIHGRHVEAHSGKTFDNVNPATGGTLSAAQVADAHDIDATVQSTRAGQAEEAITRASDTIYGLAAGVFTSDLTRTHRVVAVLQSGICWINNYGVFGMSMLAGGHKQSSIVAENGLETIHQCTRLKTIYVETGEMELPYE